MRFMDHAWAEGFIKPETRAVVRYDADPAALLEALDTVTLPVVPAWLTRRQR